MATTKLLTAEDLFEMGSDSGYELIRGELVPMPPTNHRASSLAAWLIYKLGSHVYPHQLGKISSSDGGYILSRDPDIMVAPDVAFVREDRMPSSVEQSKFLELAPDLVVEVVSPSDRFTDLHDKVMLYLNAGVQIVWVVDPERKTITEYTPDSPTRAFNVGDTIGGGDILPGFELSVSELFS